MWMEGAGMQARGFGGGPAVALDEFDLPAARREALGGSGASESRADDDGAPFRPGERRCRRVAHFPARFVFCREHVALAAVAGALLEAEAGRSECVAHA